MDQFPIPKPEAAEQAIEWAKIAWPYVEKYGGVGMKWWRDRKKRQAWEEDARVWPPERAVTIRPAGHYGTQSSLILAPNGQCRLRLDLDLMVFAPFPVRVVHLEYVLIVHDLNGAQRIEERERIRDAPFQNGAHTVTFQTPWFQFETARVAVTPPGATLCRPVDVTGRALVESIWEAGAVNIPMHDTTIWLPVR